MRLDIHKKLKDDAKTLKSKLKDKMESKNTAGTHELLENYTQVLTAHIVLEEVYHMTVLNPSQSKYDVSLFADD